MPKHAKTKRVTVDYVIALITNSTASEEATFMGLLRAIKKGSSNYRQHLLIHQASLTDDVSNNNISFLHMAALCGDPRIVELLLASGIDYRPKNFSGETAFEVAKRYRYERISACLSPDKEGRPAYLNQIKKTPRALDECVDEIGIQLPKEIRTLIVEFTFFKPSQVTQLHECAAPVRTQKLSCKIL